MNAMRSCSRRMCRVTCFAAVAVFSFVAVPAFAQHNDGARFRGGISLAGGGTFISGWTLGMAGVEARLGVQINHLLGIYAQPYFMLGAGSRGGVTGFTGFAGGAAMVDVTLLDRYFVGAGGGAAILNNPVAGELHFRVGAYPIMGYGPNGIRRRGLMVGADIRAYFVQGVTVLNIMAGIGYEAY